VAKKLEKKGAPAYMVTMADMWSLMLIFFIMLFAMSQVDASKFKKIDGSLKNTFGFNEQSLKYAPPPGVNPVLATSASDHFPDDIIFDRPTNTSINDPQFTARKIHSCEKQVTRQKNAQFVTLQNGYLIQTALENEIQQGLMTYVQKNNEASLFFSAQQAFDEDRNLKPQFQKALLKLALNLEERKGEISIRGHLPQKTNLSHLGLIQQVSVQNSLVGAALIQDVESLENKIQFEIVPYGSLQRTVSAIPSSASSTVFEIAIIKPY
jgi:chemotaxis protein MotB